MKLLKGNKWEIPEYEKLNTFDLIVKIERKKEYTDSFYHI